MNHCKEKEKEMKLERMEIEEKVEKERKIEIMQIEERKRDGDLE